MASNPYPDRRNNRGVWRMKYRPDPGGPWVTVTLGYDDRPAGSEKNKSFRVPDHIEAKAREFREKEYRARYGLAMPALHRAHHGICRDVQIDLS